MTVDVDAKWGGLAARVSAGAMPGPGSFTKLRIDVQSLQPLAIARNFGSKVHLFVIGHANGRGEAFEEPRFLQISQHPCGWLHSGYTLATSKLKCLCVYYQALL